MDISQSILKYKNIINIVENIILNKNDKIDMKTLYPSKIDWYKYNIKILKKIIKEHNDKFSSFIFYKGNGYRNINKILINESFPFIYLYNKYDINTKEMFNKTIINTEPIYIFPQDIKKISEYKQNSILKSIENIDYIFNKYYNYIKLSECILFRGMDNINDNKIYNNFEDIFNKMISRYQYKIKNNKKLNKTDEEFTFNNYISTTFNINASISFLDMYSNGASSIFLILHIKKEHNIPGIYLSDLFFDSINNEKNIGKKITDIKDYESEILLNRKITIKILKIKNIVKKNLRYKSYSIKNLYKDSENDKKSQSNKIKIVYAESCPYTLPEKFIPKNNFKYLCTRL